MSESDYCQFPRSLEQFAFGEIADEAEVGGKEVVVGQEGERGPADVVKDAVFDVAGKGVDLEKLQVDGAPVAVLVLDVSYAGTDGGGDAELFVKLTSEAISEVSPGSILPPGNSHLRLIG
jgi:hypothetical protein